MLIENASSLGWRSCTNCAAHRDGARHDSYCILVAQRKTAKPARRLGCWRHRRRLSHRRKKADLKLRAPGECSTTAERLPRFSIWEPGGRSGMIKTGAELAAKYFQKMKFSKNDLPIFYRRV